MSDADADPTPSPAGGAAPGEASKRQRRSLVEGSVFGHMMRFVVPMSLALSAMMLVGLIDAFWLGQLSTNALAAVSFAFPVMFAVMSISIGLSAGTIAAISRVASAGDHSRLQRLATDAVLLAAVLVVIVSIVGVILTRPLFALMGAEGEILDLVTTYAQIWFIGNLFVVAPSIANAILRAVGEAVLPSIMMTISAFVNMALDPIFIFGLGPVPRLEVAGAAIATVVANAVAAAAVMWVVIVREKIVVFSLPPRDVLLRHWREILHVGLPAMGSNMVNPLALSLVVASLARFGAETVAGYGAAARVEMFAIIPMFAISAAIGPLTGQNLGAGRIDRVRESFRTAFIVAMGWSLAVAGLLAIAAPFLAPAFSDDPGAQAAMRTYLWITPITMGGYGVVIAASAGFNGVSRPAPALAMTFLRSVVLLTSFVWIGGALGGPRGAFLGVAAANIVAGLLVGGWVLLRAYPPRVETAPSAVDAMEPRG